MPNLSENPQKKTSPKRKAAAKKLAASTDRVCVICQDAKRHANSKFCQSCRAACAACKADAIKQGQADVFDERSQREESLREMVLKFMVTCPSKGQGAPRDKFDWVKFIHEVYSKTELEVHEKAVMMDWVDFKAHHEKACW